MARYKQIDTSPRFLAVDLERQLLPSTFEHALNYLIDHEIDLSRFGTCYKNDLTGAAAYRPEKLRLFELVQDRSPLLEQAPLWLHECGSSAVRMIEYALRCALTPGLPRPCGLPRYARSDGSSP